jgi:diaminohydroxyphosphoribosylaminopyrimidine deaminase/5-amino-6-(5-phosphoribosylamino)uracil reductase
MATTLDGRTAAADGKSQWITGEHARIAAHQLRAESDAIVVGAGTVRIDNPSLTTRLVDGPSPRRIVLGKVAADAKVNPCLEWNQSLPELLDTLGAEGVLQLMVEGGPTVAASFHRENFVNRYVMYIAPAFMGGTDGTPLFSGHGAATIDQMWRGSITSTRIVGDDIEIVIDNNSR